MLEDAAWTGCSTDHQLMGDVLTLTDWDILFLIVSFVQYIIRGETFFLW